MEVELNKIFDPMQEVAVQKTEEDEKDFINFGMGRATSNFNALYLSNGIIV